MPDTIESSKSMKPPTLIAVEPTNRCNLQCPLCDNRIMTRTKGFMEFEKYKLLIDEVKSFARSIEFSINAEPLLHPQFSQFVDYAHRAGLKTMLGSNAILLDKFNEKLVLAGLDYTNLSMDGISRETYEKYRIGLNPNVNNFDKVKSNVEQLCELKRRLKSETPHVQISFLVNRHNEQETPTLLEWAKKTGVNTVLLKAMHFQWVEDKEKIDKIKAEWEPKDKQFIRFFDYKKLPPCTWTHKSAVVLWDGRLGSCCYDIKGETTFSNVFENGFLNCWNAQNHLKTIPFMKSRDLSMCYGCSAESKLGEFVQTNFQSIPFRAKHKVSEMIGKISRFSSE